MTYKEQLQKMSNEELIEHYRYMSKRKDVLMIKAELLNRLNEAERLREALERIQSLSYEITKKHIFFHPFANTIHGIAEQALTTPEPLKAK